MRRLWVIIALVLLATFLHSPQTVYITHGNIFNGEFTEPFEILYAICFDGQFWSFSTHEANQISLSAYYLKTFLEERGYTLKDVAIMMHNHFAMPRLSWTDSNTLLKLRNYGFRGSFGIYITSTKKVVYEKAWLRGIE